MTHAALSPDVGLSVFSLISTALDLVTQTTEALGLGQIAVSRNPRKTYQGQTFVILGINGPLKPAVEEFSSSNRSKSQLNNLAWLRDLFCFLKIPRQLGW